jgi:predicted dinucleotide-binding enzyme
MNVGVIGSGQVGEVLANGFIAHGHDVMRASRDPSKLEEWRHGAGSSASTGSPAATAAWAELVVLAVKGSGAEAAVRLCGPDALAGKTILDTTNPIADAPPEHGVLKYFTGLDDSLMERLQRQAPEAHFVKCWSSVGAALMVDPELPGGRPSMFICGNDERAKAQATEILDDFGWDTEDLGVAAAARAIEPLAILWCIPGFVDNDWMHAYRVLRP